MENMQIQPETQTVMSGTRHGEQYDLGDGRLPAFLGLARHTGGVYAEDRNGITVDDALVAAGLDFEVLLVDGVQVPVLDENGVTTVHYPKFRGTVRKDTDGRLSHLGIVKTKYRVAQNRPTLAFGQAIVDEYGANTVAVGAYGDPIGAKTYVALKLPETMLVAGQDRHDLYLTVINDHTGGGGLTVVLAPLRLSCTNQTYATFKGNPMRMSIRHTGDMSGKVQQAREVLDLTHRWVPAFEAASAQMLDTPVGDGEFERLMAQLLPEPTGVTVRSENAINEKRSALRATLASPTNDFGRGTAYAAYNALVEWADHDQPVRNDESDPTARYARIMAGSMDGFKDRAFGACMALSAAV